MTIASQVDERIAVVSPEGASLFETMTGRRYRDAAPNVPDIYLKAWGGEQITVDRVGRPALIIERPILSVCVMVQPEVISALTQYPMIVRQGGLARFLWVAARDIVGTRDRSRRRSAPPPSPVYADNLLKLGTWAAGLESPVVYTASEAAADIVDAITNEREARMGFGGDLEAHRAIEAKMAAYHWRLAGLLALAHDDRGDISVERVNAASELVDYFMAHAVAIHASAGLDDTGGGTWRRLAAWCTRHPGEPLDLKKAWGSLRSVYGSIADMRGDIEYLIALRWIKHTGGELDAIGVQSKANPTLEVDPRVA